MPAHETAGREVQLPDPRDRERDRNVHFLRAVLRDPDPQDASTRSGRAGRVGRSRGCGRCGRERSAGRPWRAFLDVAERAQKPIRLLDVDLPLSEKLKNLLPLVARHYWPLRDSSSFAATSSTLTSPLARRSRRSWTFAVVGGAIGAVRSGSRPLSFSDPASAHRASFDRADIVGALNVAAHALESHWPLHVGDVHVAGHTLHTSWTARAVQVEVAAHRLRIDGGLTRNRDLEIDAEALAPEQVEPAALLLVEMRLDEDVVALLLDADLHVLEQSLRAVGTSALHALVCDDPHLIGLTDTDGYFAGDVLNAQARHAVYGERLLDGLVVRFRVAVAIHSDERGADRARDLIGIDIDVDIEAPVPEAEFVPGLVAGTPFLPTLLVLALAIGPLLLPFTLALGAITLALLGVADTLLGVAAPLIVHRVKGHVTGSFSRSCAASSGAMRPSASSRRISLRRSASRSGSACDGKPSARIMASRRDRTVG